MSKKIAVVLSGCGFKDGGEIHESVLTLLHLCKSGSEPACFAPNIAQATVTNHLNGDQSGETRNVLVESARIARGQIQEISKLKAKDFDGLIFPGGYGAALNLCTFGQKGADCTVNPEVERVIREFHAAKKPIGAICIAPSFVAKVLGPQGVQLTIGTDSGTAAALEKMGAKHQNQPVEGICTDDKNKVVSTPAYMLGKNVAEIEPGIAALVKKVISWA